ncbi:helix-turn-helix domain protein [Mycolicibacterium rhodesiae JS60]|nr:helix-turn-helix domain protein [Mycolicibacterium rhodesiae JS60]
MGGMVGKESTRGPTADTVAANLTAVREAHNLNYTQVSDRLAAVGWSISAVGIRRIESGERRVDVDDLVALAAALDVSPATLLVPGSSHGDCIVEATGLNESIEVEFLWAWVTASQPLPDTVSMFDFWASALPLFLRKRFVEEMEKHNKVLPPSALLRLRETVRDGDD